MVYPWYGSAFAAFSKKCRAIPHMARILLQNARSVTRKRTASHFGAHRKSYREG